VFRKDRRYDGKFVYGAVTTRIYCRPSCPARNPMRRNVRMFWTAGEAERRGYVACLRCHPNSLTPAEKGIKAALDHIEAHVDQIVTLRALSGVALLSPHHLQEVFKRIVGLSPKAFCDRRRFARFKQHLKGGQSIAAACYDVGYGSSRALYERTKKHMGMTPSAYRRGGDGVQIQYSITKAAGNTVLIARTKMGLCAVLPGEEVGTLIRNLRDEFPGAEIKRESPAKWKLAMRSCRVEDPLLSRLPLDLRRRVFQAMVWNTLATGKR
jgi:AraC family transcriptional regulator, regulatory protein of adaptative response / methylated-DNA-[protein]-cysteine methyltransferase